MSAGNLIVLSLLLSLSVGVTSSFKKCCPFGEVFSGISSVNCIQAPPRATQVFLSNLNNRSITYGKLPVCEKVEHITTLSLDELTSTEIVQDFCLEILHNETSKNNVLTLVLCNSNKDKDPEYSLSESSPLSQLLNVRRCCLNNAVFDVKTGECVLDDYYSKTDHFLPVLTNYLGRDKSHIHDIKPILVHRGLPECTLGAIFTYEIDAADIVFENGTLKIPDQLKEIHLTQRISICDSLLKRNGIDPFFATLSSENWDPAESLTERNSCLELTPDHRLVVRVCRDAEYCQDRHCVRKCCLEDVDDGRKINCSAIGNNANKRNFYEDFSSFTGTAWNATEYGVQIGLNCVEAYSEYVNNTYGILANGSLKLSSSVWIPPKMYCMDSISNSKYDGLVAFICFGEDKDEDKDNVKTIISIVLMGISCIFLLLTLIVYICLPGLQNLHGKTLMCHVSSLLTAFLCYTVIHWLTNNKLIEDVTLCYILGYILLFSFLSAFSWLNVMCFDIWQTFGRVRDTIIRGRSQNKRFAFYCVYAWSLPIFITFLCILADKVHVLPTNMKPHFGEDRCWFERYISHGEIIFFSAPIGVQLIMNVVFFILTAEECNKVKAELSRVSSLDPRRKRFHADKTKFIMNVKLFTVMGISWIAEIISSLLTKYTTFPYREEFFYVPDVVNSLQGVFIFVLFVVKRRVHEALRKRFVHGGSKKRCGVSQGNSTLQDPYKVKKSASNSTLTSSFAVSSTP
ncbi:G-protein coupled receptor Mth2 [Melipona quadrifasciata]|uniref:G-protein coupled receptor Mth2 n=1 Tax=Melipona quadrifasciata TaxID=166423 RepID=A0A0M8ZUT3_9HYME|nr:G-protein coupled receptor Mth2 [Melipona quadrifasciata]